MARTEKHLFEKITSLENIEDAIMSAARGKRRKRTVRAALLDIEGTASRIRESLLDESYSPPLVRCAHEINDGIRLKKRIIIHPTFDELIVSHAVLRVLKPIFMRKFYKWSCGSIPGRGQECMIRYVNKKIHSHPEKCKYYAKLDVAKCFDSINPERLMSQLREYIRDDKTLALLGRIISANTLKLSDGSLMKVGVPIGLYTSPWFANITLSSIDRCIKDKNGMYLHVRYIDDMLIMHGNRRELKRAIEDATDVLAGLGLRWKESPVVRKWAEGTIGKFRFCGVHIMRDRIQLHDAVYIRARRTANRIKRKKTDHDRVTWYDAARIVSYGGRFRAFYSYRAFVKDVLERGNIRYYDMRMKISAHDKLLAKERKNHE